MFGSKEETKSITSDKLHNKNCFNYLRNIKLPKAVIELKSLPPDMATALSSLQDKKKEDYDPSYPYGDLYKQFFAYLEENIETIYDKAKYDLNTESARIEVQKDILQSQQQIFPSHLQRRFIGVLGFLDSIKKIGVIDYNNKEPEVLPLDEILNKKAQALKEELNALDDFICSLYANDNHILEDTFENIKEITLNQTPNSPSIEKSISHHVSDKETPINQNSKSPSYEGSALGRLTAMMSDDYKPQHGTSLSTIRHYNYNRNGPIEYRFGTQGQRHHGTARISPLFERFLKIEAEREQERVEQAKKERAKRLIAKKEQDLKKQTQEELEVDNTIAQEELEDDDKIDEDRITHIYFNLLGRDRDDFEGKKEKELTEQLEGLEIEHKNIAVITLPADKGLMSQDAYADTKPQYKPTDLKEEFLRIAQESEGYNLHLKSELPKDLNEYTGSYIYCNDVNNNKKTVLY